MSLQATLQRNTQLTAGPGSSELAFDPSLAHVFHAGIKTLGMGRSLIYYRPSIDTLVVLCTGLSLGQILLNASTKRVLKKLTMMEQSQLEVARRELRWKIVEAAEKIWTEKAPARSRQDNNQQETNINDVALALIADLDPVSKVHRRTRALLGNTFAPVEKLRHFLFAPWLLVDAPSTVASVSESSYVWLRDPTKRFTSANVARRLVDSGWIRATAHNMLNKLTDIYSPEYNGKEMGGSVTTWINAATKWNTARLNKELADGSTLRMDYITSDMRHRNGGMHRGLVSLRRALRLSGDPFAEVEMLDSTFPSIPDHAVNKHFHKIVRNSCQRCPVSAFMFYPCGLEGMLTHMRVSHQMFFWTGQFHSIG